MESVVLRLGSLLESAYKNNELPGHLIHQTEKQMRLIPKFLKDPDLWGLVGIFGFLYLLLQIASVVDPF